MKTVTNNSRYQSIASIYIISLIKKKKAQINVPSWHPERMPMPLKKKTSIRR